MTQVQDTSVFKIRNSLSLLARAVNFEVEEIPGRAGKPCWHVSSKNSNIIAEVDDTGKAKFYVSDGFNDVHEEIDLKDLSIMRMFLSTLGAKEDSNDED